MIEHEITSKLHHAIFAVESGTFATARELAREAVAILDRILEDGE